jgi:hypothetical protein
MTLRRESPKDKSGQYLEVYNDMIEICDRDGIPLFLGELSEEYLELV